MTGIKHGSCTLLNADCREVLPLFWPTAVVTDPPYGISYAVNSRTRRISVGLETSKKWKDKTAKRGSIAGDSEPFDPREFAIAAKLAFFGASHFAQRLPDRPGRWVVWDKRRDSTPDDHSDCEFVWLSGRGADRIHRQKWRGIVREGEENCSRSRKLHPNQKPVALIGFIFDQLGIGDGDIVVDPFMGSGSVGVCCARRGIEFVGIEIDPKHFAVAERRIAAESHPDSF